MKQYERSARITLYAGRAVMLVGLVLILTFPMVIEWYHEVFRQLHIAERAAIIAGFYACSVPTMLAFWKMDRLLRNILNKLLFTVENVNIIRTIRWCCLAVSVFCLAASFGFPSLLFLSAIMGFMCLVINVVGQVMKAAVELREENDLTV